MNEEKLTFVDDDVLLLKLDDKSFLTAPLELVRDIVNNPEKQVGIWGTVIDDWKQKGILS